MNLTRLFAYEVFPQKGVANPVQPEGGLIKPQSELKRTLANLIRDNRLDSQTPISFCVDDPRAAHRQNAVRERLMRFAFGAGATIGKNAGDLALRLSQVMDDRSNPFLLLLSCFKDKSKARVVLWAFPKDEGLKFSTTAKGAKVEVVEDVFNISSALKKAAIFTGENKPNSFWEGRMVDIQSGRTDLWVERFLACRLSVSGIYGTTLLSEHLTKAYKQSDSLTVREELFNAIVGVRTAPVKRTSFLKFANDYLGNDAKSEFLAVVPVDQQRMSFDFDRDTFEKKIGFRAFKMSDDVFITAPLGTIDQSVQIQDDQLEYAGTITDDYLKAGRRG
ncbi:hypothetical protein [Planctomycetes bacterium TBK1r]|uniref:Nucleoid-associated protein n=1 Tax=Stieleria magnilauensis TaxID=2527963 RepID=A0ABX5XU76_9BACT|nr:hypothetical protein TBK1r_45970 [Planctomycetes bacterium TBK1r]